MNRLFYTLAALALTCLAACGATPTDRINSAATVAAGVADATGAPAPSNLLARTALDEHGLTLAAQGVKGMALMASLLVHSGVITAGSPKAIALADALHNAAAAVNDAVLARNALNAPSYSAALERARVAIAAIQATIGGN